MSDVAAILASMPRWQRERALLWERICMDFDHLKSSGLATESIIAELKRRYDGEVIDDGKAARPLKLSGVTIKRMMRKWRKGGRKATAFKIDYIPGKKRMPQALVNEFQRRLTLEGMRNVSPVIDWIERDWIKGEHIPGLGTWREWWVAHHKNKPLPQQPPKFPFSLYTFYRKQPLRALRALGNKGIAAFNCEAPTISRDYSRLRPGELYVMDDKRPDLLIIDDFTGEVTDVAIYVCLEGSSRRAVGFTARPAKAMNAQDVIALIARVLAAEGYSEEYITHILLERGTVAVPERLAKRIEQYAEGHIFIHRTGMDGGTRAPGFAADKSSGHWMGKGVIESFMRKLDLLIMHLPGQRGNRAENMPANLAHTFKRKVAQTEDGQVVYREIKGGVAAEAEMLAKCEIMLGRKIGLESPLLYLSEFNSILRELMLAYNASRDHECTDFGKVSQYWDDAEQNWKDAA